MNPASAVAATLAIGLASLLTCRQAWGQPEAAADLEAMVKDYAFRNQPKLLPQTRFVIDEYAIDGLKKLKVRMILARYLAPDGSQFNEALLILHDGKLTSFAATFGGHGLMSAAVSEGKLYYTYSFGSGRHRSHLGQMSLVDGKLTFAESDALLHEDCFVKRDGARIRAEKGEFEKFNQWKANEKIGEVVAKDVGFAVLDDAGKEIEAFAGKSIPARPAKK